MSRPFYSRILALASDVAIGVLPDGEAACRLRGSASDRVVAADEAAVVVVVAAVATRAVAMVAALAMEQVLARVARAISLAACSLPARRERRAGWQPLEVWSPPVGRLSECV
jgi:hypothetical protein